VTHDQLEAMTLADRVILMRGGQIEQAGTPSDLYHFPQTLFAAGFIGTPAMNFIDAVVQRVGDACFVLAQGQRWPLAGPRFAALHHGRAVKLAIRPNYLKVASAAEEPGTLRLQGKVELIELLGAEALVTLDFSGERLAALVPAGDLPELDNVVTFQFKVADLHIFDVQTERNVSFPVHQNTRITFASPAHQETGVQGAALH